MLVRDVPDDVIQRTLATLEPEAAKRCAAFVFEHSRREYLVTRALVRDVLAAHTEGPLAFARSEYGKPSLDPPRDLHFNLTNTKELVGCAIVRGWEIGLDAEPLDRGDTILEIAETVFVASERDEIAGLGLGSRRRRAVEMWTRKEAYMKALGTGLSLPPLEVVLADVERTHAFATFEVADHLLALCIDRAGPTPSSATLVRHTTFAG